MAMRRVTWQFDRGQWLAVGNTLRAENEPDGYSRVLLNWEPAPGGGLMTVPPTNSLYYNAGWGDPHSAEYYKSVALIGHYTAGSGKITNGSTNVDYVTGLADSPITFGAFPPTVGKPEVLFWCNDAGTMKRFAGPAATWATTRYDYQGLWGINPPTSLTGVSVAATAQSSATVDLMNNASTFTGTDCTPADDATNKIEGTNSMRLESGSGGVIPKDTHAYASKNLGSPPPLDLTNMGSGPGTSSEQDFIQCFIRANRPKNLLSVTVTFAVGDTTFNHAYTREVPVLVANRRRRKRLIGEGDLIRKRDQATWLQDNYKKTKDLSFQELHGAKKVSVAKNCWSRLTLPKATFEETGLAGTSGYTWANVYAVRVEMETSKQGGTKTWWDDLRMIGGVGMTGDYQYTFTFYNSATGTRSNPPLDSDGNILFIEVRNLERQGATITGLSAAALNCTELTADKIEVWRTIGNGDVYFKATERDLDLGTGIASLNTWSDTVADYVGLQTDAGTVLDATRTLLTDNTSPRLLAGQHANYFTRFAGPRGGRLWYTGSSRDAEKGRLYYSPIGRLEAVAGWLELSRGGDPLTAVAIWEDRIFAFTKTQVWEILNSDEPFIPRLLQGIPGTNHPRTVVATPRGLCWRGDRGIYLYNGVALETLSDRGLSMAFTRGGTSGNPVATTDFTVATYGRGKYLINGYEGSLWLYDFEREGWFGCYAYTPNGVLTKYVPELDQFWNRSASSVVEFFTAPYSQGDANAAATLHTAGYANETGKLSYLTRVYVTAMKTSGSSVTTAAVTPYLDGSTIGSSLGNPWSQTYFPITVAPGYGAQGLGGTAVFPCFYPFGSSLAIRITVTDNLRECKLLRIAADVYTPD